MSLRITNLFTLILVVSIALSTQLPAQCDFGIPSDGEAYMWCAMSGSSVGLAWIMFLLSK